MNPGMFLNETRPFREIQSDRLERYEHGSLVCQKTKPHAYCILRYSLESHF